MSANTNLAKTTVEAFNNRDWSRMTSSLAPNCVYDEVSTGRRVTGHPEILEVQKGWAEAFEDVKGTITNTFEQNDTVILELTWKGKHTGPLDGPTGTIPPSGRSVTTRSVQLLRCSNNKVVEVRQYFDMYALLREINAIPVAEKGTAKR